MKNPVKAIDKKEITLKLFSIPKGKIFARVGTKTHQQNGAM